MKDWTKEPYTDREETFHKNKCLATKRTLDFISKYPDGVTGDDFKAAGIPIVGIDRLMKLKLIVRKHIPEPERGPRAYHSVWKLNPHKPADEEVVNI